MSGKKPKDIFIEGPIPPSFIAESIGGHGSKTAIGAHSIFLGQVRADEILGRIVTAIDYTAYAEMALEKMHDLREAAFARHALTCLHVHHSLGRIAVGEICLFVFASSPHRGAAIKACAEIVEAVKSELPIWGRECFDDETHRWKENIAS